MTQERDRLLVLLAAVTSGMAAASVNIAARFATDPGDVLGFFGGGIGAGLAVLGAIYLEHRKLRSAQRNYQRMVGECLIMIATAAELAKDAEGEDLWSLVATVEQQFAALQSIRQIAPIDDPYVAGYLAILDHWKDEWLAACRDIRAELDKPSVDPEDYKRATKSLMQSIISTIILIVKNAPGWPPDVREYINDISSPVNHDRA